MVATKGFSIVSDYNCLIQVLITGNLKFLPRQQLAEHRYPTFTILLCLVFVGLIGSASSRLSVSLEGEERMDRLCFVLRVLGRFRI